VTSCEGLTREPGALRDLEVIQEEERIEIAEGHAADGAANSDANALWRFAGEHNAINLT
jgi:hypothetical protein